MAKRKHANEELRNAVFSISDIECRDNAESGTVHIHGCAVVFGQTTRINGYWESFDEVIDRHALDNADMTDVALFWNHDMTMIPFARTRNGNGTLSLEIRDDGLWFDADLDVDGNSTAAAAVSALRRKDVDKMSFAFRIRKQEWSNLDAEEGDVPLRTIKDISVLHEISIVTYPAYDGTSVDARSDDGEEAPHCESLVEARKALEETKATALELAKLKARAMFI